MGMLLFYINTTARNIARQKYKSALSVFICIIIVLLLNVYIGNISSINSQLARLPDAIPISAQISNLSGTMDAGMAIKESVIDGLAASPYVKEPVFTVQLVMGEGLITVDDYHGELNLFCSAVNDMRGVSGLKESELTMAEGTAKDFFASDKYEIILDEYIMEEKGLQLGDMIDLTAFYYKYQTNNHEILFEPLCYREFRIAGSMSIAEYTGSVIFPSILMPYQTVVNIFHELGLPFTADSASFQVDRPFELNEFKEEMKEIGLLSVITDASFQYDGNALVVRDSTFIEASEPILGTKSLLVIALPFIIAIVIFIGYITAYLLIYSRRGEYAVMRSLGMRHMQCFNVLLLENALLQLIGCAIGSLIAGLAMGMGLSVLAGVAALFLLCYLAGSAIALWNMGKLSVMEVLTKEN